MPDSNPLVLSPSTKGHSILAFPPRAIKYTTDCLRGVRATPVELCNRNQWAQAQRHIKEQVLENQDGWFRLEELVYPVRLEWYFNGGTIPLFGGHDSKGAMWDSVIQAFSEGSLLATMNAEYIRRLDGSGGEH
jgi:hypothetical protein